MHLEFLSEEINIKDLSTSIRLFTMTKVLENNFKGGMIMLIHSFRSFWSLLLGPIVSKITANRSSDGKYIADQNCSPHDAWGEESLTRARKDTLQRSPH